MGPGVCINTICKSHFTLEDNSELQMNRDVYLKVVPQGTWLSLLTVGLDQRETRKRTKKTGIRFHYKLDIGLGFQFHALKVPLDQKHCFVSQGGVLVAMPALVAEKAMALQYSCLENTRDSGAWWAAVYGGRTESDPTETAAAAAALVEECNYLSTTDSIFVLEILLDPSFNHMKVWYDLKN